MSDTQARAKENQMMKNQMMENHMTTAAATDSCLVPPVARDRWGVTLLGPRAQRGSRMDAELMLIEACKSAGLTFDRCGRVPFTFSYDRLAFRPTAGIMPSTISIKLCAEYPTIRVQPVTPTRDGSGVLQAIDYARLDRTPWDSPYLQVLTDGKLPEWLPRGSARSRDPGAPGYIDPISLAPDDLVGLRGIIELGDFRNAIEALIRARGGSEVSA